MFSAKKTKLIDSAQKNAGRQGSKPPMNLCEMLIDQAFNCSAYRGD